MTTISQAVSWGVAQLGDSPSATLDAQLLLAHVLGVSRLQVITRGEQQLSEMHMATYAQAIERRQRFVPLAYITGEREFYSRAFKVSPAVLVPRPETELLVARAVAEILKRAEPVQVVDLGTGSGCIAITVVLEARKHGRQIRMVATDVSAEALDVARENASRWGCADAIEFQQGGWWQALPTGVTFDLVLSNPPYVQRGASDTSPELRHEPQGALYAAAGGLADIVEICAGLPTHLSPTGVAIIEHGSEHTKEILAGALPADVQCVEQLHDLQRHPRCVIVRRS